MAGKFVLQNIEKDILTDFCQGHIIFQKEIGVVKDIILKVILMVILFSKPTMTFNRIWILQILCLKHQDVWALWLPVSHLWG